MSETQPLTERKIPIFSILGGVILVLNLLTPLFLATFPIMAAVALSITGAARKEKPLFFPYIVITAAAIFWLITGSHFSPFKQPTPAPTPLPSQTYANATWEYSTSKDQMRGTTSTLATLDSPTDFTLRPPYDGFNHAHIIVSSNDSIILVIDKGQFMCHGYSGHDDYVSVKFDDGPVYRYVCGMPDNGESDTLYINYKPFDAPKEQPEPLAGILKSKKMTVEAEMFDNGFQQITFNVSGLDKSRLK